MREWMGTCVVTLVVTTYGWMHEATVVQKIKDGMGLAVQCSGERRFLLMQDEDVKQVLAKALLLWIRLHQ